jgi:hypothetical protein
LNISDERSISEQVKSGFRLAGFVLLTLVFVYALLFSAALLENQGTLAQSFDRRLAIFLGSTGLLVLSVLMFLTVRYWAKWFFGFLGYSTFNAFFFLVAGPTSRLHTTRSDAGAMLLILLAITVLCLKYAARVPRKVESIGLVAAILALSFGLTLNSFIPMLLGGGALGLAQLVDWRWQILHRRGTSQYSRYQTTEQPIK